MKDMFSAFPALTTERLLLRDYEKQDFETVFFLRSDEKMNQFIKREPPSNIEEAVAFVRKVQSAMKMGESVNWVICEKTNGVMIGSICLWNFSEDGKTGELGYDLHPNHQNKGFMNEAVKEVLHYGFSALQFDQICAYTHRLNERSKNVLMKNGFILLKNARDEHDENNIILSLSRSNFESENK